jgi:hypothetical protein
VLKNISGEARRLKLDLEDFSVIDVADITSRGAGFWAAVRAKVEKAQG